MTDLSQRIASLSPEKRALLEARLLREKSAAAPIPAIPRRATDGPAPLAFAQQRLWFLDQLDPGRPYYNLPLALRLVGDLDAPALTRSLDAIVARHDSLRTTFPTRDGGPMQVIGSVRRIAVERRDVGAHADPAAATDRIVAEELARPFDLANDSMVRAMLIRESDRSHVLLLMMHHIASDGWSVGVLIQEIAALYTAFRRGVAPVLPELPIQYADFAVWQRDWLRGGIEEAQLAYWKDRLAGELPLLQLPTDRARPARQSFAGAQERKVYPRALAERLEALSREAGATLFMTLLAAFQALLARLSGQEDILVGTPTAGRNRVETENLVGFFVNTLVIRGDLSGDPTFRDLLGRVREQSLGAYAHQDVPFERLVETLHPDRDLAHTPIFQAMFAFENYPLSYPEMPGLRLENVEFETIVSNFDLSLDIAMQDQGLSVSFEYATDLFDAATVRRWLDNFEALLSGIAADPGRKLSELSLLTDAERDTLLVAWNATDAEVPPQACVHELFETQAARDPEAVAVECEGRRLSYGELDQKANRLAHRLRELGVGPDVPVGIGLDRSVELPIALLAVLKAGGAYVPLDPSYPPSRLRYFLEDSGAPVLLTEERLAGLLGAGPWKTVLVDGAAGDGVGAAAAVERPAGGAGSENLAYILYTSGSTGRPKGVLVSHRSLVNHATAIRRLFDLRPSDRVLQFASLSFDVAGEEIFPTWAAGAALVLRPPEAIGVAEYEKLLEARRPTVVNLPSGFWHEWVSELSRTGRPVASSLRIVVAGSERVLPEKLAWWRANVPASIRWLNGYGPTEATITTTLYEPRPGDAPGSATVPIGRPIANVRLYVVDPRGALCPIGVAGELWIGGAGVARGYRGDPEKTAEKFVPDPFGPPGARVYRTGDRVRYRSDGNLEFLGRLDGQVKIRGFRIELGEIEAALEQHPDVREAAVAAREDSGESRLVGYVALHPGGAAAAADLRAFLKEKLPAYMVPAAFVTMESLPRTGSGKVDRARLPDPGQLRDAEADFVAPRTPVEETVAQIWSELLRVERIGIHDNFFDLGGHSLLATQVVSRLRAAFSLELPLRVLFESPTIAELSLAIAQAQAERAAPEDLARLLEELERESPPEPLH